ncbi:MAG: SAP domain-containing protein, partial [Euryarchaeota archaeon]|nr:SAP domain-containing protein [Euryarchaeota archaeon]
MSPTSSLTVAALKQLCREKELAISGKKSDLVSRLLKYGASEEELGIEVEESEDTEIIEDEAGELILESEMVEEKEIFETDEVLEAEILEAEILEVELVREDEEIPTLIETATGARFSTPEVDWKKTAAVVASLLVLGGGAWWWFSLEAQPFTPDPLRHGDEMGFAVTGGEMVATEEYASKVFEWFGSDDDVCELNVGFSGKGSIEIKEGDSTDLSGEMGNDRLGAVKQRGGSGFSWLTMEKELQYDFDDVSISKSEQLKIGCQEMPSVSARVGIDWTEWV